MKKKPVKGLDYSDEETRTTILDRARRSMWTPEQIASLATHFRLKPGMRLLDVGCGHAYCLRTYGPSCLPGGELVGVDREALLLEKAANLAAEDGLGGVSTFCRGNVYDLPFDSGTFDITLCQTVLCHLDRPESALDEMIRVTRAGGCVAVFDNAMGGGASCWFSVLHPTLAHELVDYEMGYRQVRGRKKLGLGSFSVGLFVPGWMESKGLEDVDVRQNERVRWIAPPYVSSGQQVELNRMKEQLGTTRGLALGTREDWVAMMEAGGANEAEIKSAWRASLRRDRKLREGLSAGNLAYGINGNFWCMWGFK